MPRGETIVGDSFGYTGTMPMPPRRGPNKQPMLQKVRLLEEENAGLKSEMGTMKDAMLKLQESQTRMMGLMMEKLGGNEKDARGKTKA